MTFTQIKTCQAANAMTVFSRVIITTAFHKSARKTALTRQTFFNFVHHNQRDVCARLFMSLSNSTEIMKPFRNMYGLQV